ncbi:MAG: hypothetical protein ACK5SQ_03365, partial [Chitinophagales bacterium]
MKEAGLIGNNVKVDANSIALEVASDPNAAAVMAQLEPGDAQNYLPDVAPSSDNSYRFTESSSNPMETTNKPGLLSWVQANPLPSLAIAGDVGLVLYNMTSKKKKGGSSGLSGVRSRKSSSSRSTRSTRKRRKPIKTILLR